MTSPKVQLVVATLVGCVLSFSVAWAQQIESFKHQSEATGGFKAKLKAGVNRTRFPWTSHRLMVG